MKQHDYFMMLQAGHIGKKPKNITWNTLEYAVKSAQYPHLNNAKLHRMAGGYFMLSCKYCNQSPMN